MVGKSPITADGEQRAALRALAHSRDRGEADRARAMLLTLRRSSALSFTTYFLTAISFLTTNHLHRCFRGDRDSENHQQFLDAGDS